MKRRLNLVILAVLVGAFAVAAFSATASQLGSSRPASNLFGR